MKVLVSQVENRVCLASFNVAVVTYFDFEATLICSLVDALQTFVKRVSLALLV